MEMTTRKVPIVDMNTVHEAEAAFFEKYPDARELIAEWMSTVNVLVVGDARFTNVRAQ